MAGNFSEYFHASDGSELYYERWDPVGALAAGANGVVALDAVAASAAPARGAGLNVLFLHGVHESADTLTAWRRVSSGKR